MLKAEAAGARRQTTARPWAREKCALREVSMYPYHNKIKQRIRQGELAAYAYVQDYPRIGPALVLYFCTYPPMRPIRPHRWAEYAPLLAQWEARRGP